MTRSRTAAVLVVACLVATHARAQDGLGDPFTVDGVEVRGFRTATEGRALPHIQHRAGVRVSITSGRRPERTRGARTTTVRVCDADAIRTEVSFPGTESVRVTIPGRDDPSAHLIAPARPAMTYVRVEIRRGDRVVSIEWAVPTARREARRALEDAFFASIRCTS